MFAAHQLAGPIQSFPPDNVHGIPKTLVALNTTATLKKIKVNSGRSVYIEAAIKAKNSAGTMGLFLLKAVARNVAGTLSLLGAASLVSFRDGTEITVGVAVDDATDHLLIQATAATLTATNFAGQVQVTEYDSDPE
jgi:hypothetical protein